MAIPKKGSRSIVVDGTKYRWRVRKKVSYGQLLSVLQGHSDGTTFAVELAENPGSVLRIQLPDPHPSLHSYSSVPIVPIVPAQVAHYIALALVKGWQPSKPGSSFNLVVRDSG